MLVFYFIFFLTYLELLNIQTYNMDFIYLITGEDSGGRSVPTAKMLKGRSVIRGRKKQTPDLWGQQTGRESGKQVPKVLRVHVESTFMGDGGSSNHGHCVGKR